MTHSRSAVLPLLLFLFLGSSPPAHAGTADDILALTGGNRVKLVWAQNTADDCYNWDGTCDAGCDCNGYELYRYDTDDDTVQRVLTATDSYVKPHITHDGARIVFTDLLAGKVRAVGIDGGAVQTIAQGYAGTIWYDAASDIEWVYVQKNGRGGGSSDSYGAGLPLVRVNLDDTNQEQLVWDRTGARVAWLAISGDGKRLVAGWPNKDAGVIIPDYDGGGDGQLIKHVDGNDSTPFVRGCWTTITPDDTYEIGVFDGLETVTHRKWHWFDPTGDPLHDLRLDTNVPGMTTTAEVYYPKYSNHPRFITLTAPWNRSDAPANVLFAQVDSGLTKITSSVQITDSSHKKIFPTAWIEPATVRIDSFEAAPTTITAGETATLSWSTTHATDVTLSPDVGAVSNDGQTTVTPTATTEYTLVAEGNGGSVNRKVTVNVAPAGLASITVTPPGGAVIAGGSLALTARPLDASGDAIAAVLAWQVSGGGSMAPVTSAGEVTEHTVTFLSDGSTGTFEVTVSSGDVEARVDVAVVAASGVHIKANCGSSDVPGWDDAAPYLTNGVPFDFGGTVDLNDQPNPAPADLYRTCVHGDHQLSFPVPDGRYQVRLHFFDNRTVERAMSFTLEGVTVLEGFSIVDAAGGLGRALIREFEVEVSDGDGLQIVGSAGAGSDVFESGVEIASVDDGAPTISIASPAGGDKLAGTVLIAGVAEDATGIARVDVRIDDGEYAAADGTSSWSYMLHTAMLPDGYHTITARVTDLSGRTAETEITVETANAPSIAIQRPAAGDRWPVGSVQTIVWSTENLEDVEIFLSLDGGETVEPEMIQTSITPSHDSWGNLAWTVPDKVSDEAVIVIVGYFDEASTSSERFAITAAGDQQTDTFTFVGSSCAGSPAPAPLVLLALLVILCWHRRIR